MLGAVAKTSREPSIRTVHNRWGQTRLQLAGPECPRGFFRLWLPVLGQQAKPRLLSFPWPCSGTGPLLPPGCLLGTEPVWSGSGLGSLRALTPSVQAALGAPQSSPASASTGHWLHRRPHPKPFNPAVLPALPK